MNPRNLLRKIFKRPRVNSETGQAYNVADETGVITNLDNITPDDYKRMLDSDGTIKGLYNTFKNVVLSLPWTVEGPNAEMIMDNFTKPYGHGGMSITMREVIAHMLLAKLYGWSPFEKVYTVHEGRIILQKLAPRSVFNYEIRSDKKGGFNGIKQVEPEKLIDIPNSFVFTINTEHARLYGESDFKTAYKHFLQKEALDKLDDKAAERYTVPPEVLTTPHGTTPAERSNSVREVQDKGFNSVITLPSGTAESGDYKLESLNPTIMSNLAKIDYHNYEAARSLGMQFIMIVGASSVSGSYALSKDQSQIFIQSVEETTTSIEESLNKYVIAPLIAVNNPGATEFPVFKFGNVPNDKLIDLAAEILKTAQVSEELRDVANKTAINYLGEEAEELTFQEMPAIGESDDEPDDEGENSAQ